MTPKEEAVTNYVREKHNQDECSGFIDGYEKCQQDIAKDQTVTRFEVIEKMVEYIKSGTVM
jgi:hypothetical protein